MMRLVQLLKFFPGILFILILGSVPVYAENNAEALEQEVIRELNDLDALQHPVLDKDYDVMIIDNNSRMVLKGQESKEEVIRLKQQSNYLLEVDGIKFYQIETQTSLEKKGE
jgi:hypothetical protein